ncbi:MAG: CvpA family protein [Planctomycetes bacterium]|nr:CvpA family protein [Planctomycetota bacterium]
MAVLVAIIAGVGLGLLYSRRGLFLAAIALVAAFISIMTALGFGATVVHTVGVQSEYAYGITMLAIATFVFLAIRGSLVFINEDVDFHPLVERVGGALVGLALGVLVIGFGCVCMLSMPFPEVLRNARPNTEQATDLVLVPCQTVTRLLPGRRPFQLKGLLSAGGAKFSVYVKPPPPPPPELEASEESSSQQELSDPDDTNPSNRERDSG